MSDRPSEMQEEALSRLVNSEVIKHAPFIDYSEAYENAKEVLAKTKKMMEEINK